MIQYSKSLTNQKSKSVSKCHMTNEVIGFSKETHDCQYYESCVLLMEACSIRLARYIQKFALLMLCFQIEALLKGMHLLTSGLFQICLHPCEVYSCLSSQALIDTHLCVSRALLSGDQGYYSCSSEMYQDHQKLDSFTPFLGFTTRSTNSTPQITIHPKNIQSMEHLAFLLS